jgi:hypothetical protein
MLRRSFWQFTDVLEVLAVSIIRSMEAAGISETSMNSFQITRRSIPEDSHLLTFVCNQISQS